MCTASEPKVVFYWWVRRGAGKTLLARALPDILPALSQREAVEVTSIVSFVGMLPRGHK